MLRRIDEGRFGTDDPPVAELDDVLELRRLVRRVYLDPAITEYIVSLTYVTRHVDEYLPPELARLVEVGASPRAAIHFAAGARAVALLQGRDHVIPEDVRRLGHRVLRHRMLLGFEAAAAGIAPERVVDAVFAAVRTP